MGRLMKWLFILSVVGAAGWSLWWYAGARGQESGIAAWLEKQRDRGWQAEAAEIAVAGYPLDFNMTARDVALTDPRNGWSWTAPELRADSKSYKPTRIAVTWPQEQRLATPFDHAVITSDKLETLLDVRPGPSMELRQASTDIAALKIAGRTGWRAGTEMARLNIAEKPDDLAPPNSYDLDLEALKLILPKQVVERIDPTGWLKPSVDRLTATGHFALDTPLDRSTIEQGEIALRAATIREAGFQWGKMVLIVSGAFNVDADGYPVGEIQIEAREWRQMVRLAVSSGLVDRGTADAVAQGIEFLTGGGDDLVAPLGLSGGKIRLGPFAVADAPRLAPPQ